MYKLASITALAMSPKSGWRFISTTSCLMWSAERHRRTLTSTLDPVVHVGDTALPLEDPGALQLDLLGSKALEQTAPLAEEHRDDMELDLVEDAGGKCERRGSDAVDQHVLIARSLLGLSHGTGDIVHVGNQRPLP